MRFVRRLADGARPFACGSAVAVAAEAWPSRCQSDGNSPRGADADPAFPGQDTGATVRFASGPTGPAAGRPLRVYVTGFGPFGSITENPTSAICRWLQQHKAELAKQGVEAIGMDIVEVSAEAARAKAVEIASALAGLPGPSCVLHLGIAPNSQRLCLECRAANVANFPIPDMRGWVASNEPIIEGAPKHKYTALPLVELLCELHDRGIEMDISTSAGTYICNYIYYQSLMRVGRSGVQVLFVHTPSFETVGEPEQAKAIEELLLALRKLADRGRF